MTPDEIFAEFKSGFPARKFTAGLLVALISPYELSMAAYALAGSVTAVYSVQRYRTRNAVTTASAMVGGVNILMGLAVMLGVGNGTFGSPVLYGSGDGTTAVRSVAVNDFNNDGICPHAQYDCARSNYW